MMTMLLVSTLTACKKSFLEIEPKGKLIARTTGDYDLLLNNLDLMTFFGSPHVLMGDEIAATEVYFTTAPITSQRLFRWDKDIYDVTEEAGEFNGPLKALYTYNKIINEVETSEDGSQQQKNGIRAEALAGRAWVNFFLINLYGKPYRSATAGNDLGFPLITEATVVNDKFERASVQAVYDSIIKDLTTAIPMLSKIVFRSRMSKSAAEALLGKVYLFMGRPEEALPLLDAAFSDLGGSLIPVGLYDYNQAMAPGGSFYPLNPVFGPPYPTFQNDQESIYARQNTNSWAGLNNLAILTKKAVGLYKSSDLRLNFFSTNPFPSGDAFPEGMRRRLAPNSIQCGFVLPDLYLLRAEARVRTKDLNGAVADVEMLRSKRMPVTSGDVEIPAADKADQLNLLKYVIDERTREFALTGYRWFDMRRLSVDPLFQSDTYTHTLYLSNGNTQNFALRPERLVLRLPLKVTVYNPGMPDNP